MFIQVIQGRCTRQQELRGLLERWETDLSGGAAGWLGGTYGFTDDGHFIGVVRFADRDAAMANSNRPEQDEWASELPPLFDGPIEFHDCDDATVFLDGGSNSAGFVQVIQGRTDDPDRMRAMLADSDGLREARPEVIGGTLAIADDGRFTQTVAFTSEAEAREGEAKEMPDMPAEARETFETAMKDAAFHDLRQPWFATAPG